MSDQGSANGAAVGVLEPGAPSFVSYDPADGGEVATFPAMTAEQVRAVVGEARQAFAWWSSLSWAERERQAAQVGRCHHPRARRAVPS